MQSPVSQRDRALHFLFYKHIYKSPLNASFPYIQQGGSETHAVMNRFTSSANISQGGMPMK